MYLDFGRLNEIHLQHTCKMLHLFQPFATLCIHAKMQSFNYEAFASLPEPFVYVAALSEMLHERPFVLQKITTYTCCKHPLSAPVLSINLSTEQ
ncbi:MAG: hypothetical protein IT327_08110 [Anaerolineae bacterium]|nr:hypothetical protein [Anaerolineae bacterium]